MSRRLHTVGAETVFILLDSDSLIRLASRDFTSDREFSGKEMLTVDFGFLIWPPDRTVSKHQEKVSTQNFLDISIDSRLRPRGVIER
jgi:hypothetical protein